MYNTVLNDQEKSLQNQCKLKRTLEEEQELNKRLLKQLKETDTEK